MALEQADQSCVEFQKMYQARVGKTIADLNADTAAPTRRTVRKDGVVYVNDLCYGTEYPASCRCIPVSIRIFGSSSTIKTVYKKTHPLQGFGRILSYFDYGCVTAV